MPPRSQRRLTSAATRGWGALSLSRRFQRPTACASRSRGRQSALTFLRPNHANQDSSSKPPRLFAKSNELACLRSTATPLRSQRGLTPAATPEWGALSLSRRFQRPTAHGPLRTASPTYATPSVGSDGPIDRRVPPTLARWKHLIGVETASLMRVMPTPTPPGTCYRPVTDIGPHPCRSSKSHSADLRFEASLERLHSRL